MVIFVHFSVLVSYLVTYILIIYYTNGSRHNTTKTQVNKYYMRT